jgi:hypothetical protein
MCFYFFNLYATHMPFVAALGTWFMPMNKDLILFGI